MAESTFVSQYPLPPKKLYKDGALQSEPPKPPAEGDTYAMFGTSYSTEEKLPSLEEAGRKVLYDAGKKRTEELKRLNKLLLQTFLSLVQTLCTEPDPEAYRAKVREQRPGRSEQISPNPVNFCILCCTMYRWMK